MTKAHFKGSTMLNPVPVALITSSNKKNQNNIFTVGWIGTACTKPPMITVAIRPERLSYKFIKETKEFVINLPSKSLVKKVDFCGVKSGTIIDKIKHLNFTLEKSKVVNVPAISECPVSIECKLKSITPLGTHDLFLAEVVSIGIEQNLIDSKGKFHLEKANLICYSHGEYFNLPQNSIGSFGFSVRKKNKRKK